MTGLLDRKLSDGGPLDGMKPGVTRRLSEMWPGTDEKPNTVAELTPGHMYALSFPGALSDETAARIRQHWQTVAPGTSVIVISDGARIVDLTANESVLRLEKKIDALAAAIASLDLDRLIAR